VAGHHPAFRLASGGELTAEHSGTALRHWSSGGMTIAAEVIPGDAHVRGDFFFVGDGASGTTVMSAM
jgi:hypothetical protein